MNLDDELPRKPYNHQLGADLSTYSVSELEEYAASLDQEKQRVMAMIDAKNASLNAADAIFKS